VTQENQNTGPVPVKKTGKVVAIRLRQTGKVENFDAAGVVLVQSEVTSSPAAQGGESSCAGGGCGSCCQVQDWVVVDTAHGLELGRVVTAPRDPTQEEAAAPLKPVLRKATAEDFEQMRKWDQASAEALTKTREVARKLSLKMKPIAARYNLDGSQLTIYFTAEERIDFRELVRDLRHQLRTRVELRQVGPRDEAKLLGAVGKCGRALCCMTFIDEFAPISIRMAKDQELSLSPMKVSGVCGRLLCCLGYEAEHYRKIKEKAPRLGQEVTTPQGNGIVVGVSALRETANVRLANETNAEVPITQLTWEKRARQPMPQQDRGRRQGTGRAPTQDPPGPAPATAPPPSPPDQRGKN